jgi:DedD protein
MSERLQDADRAVDEQKRRARRRLVGAVVLAAAAAVIVPMLLEKEPQPLGEDVSVQIPPVDEGKFVNRLTRGKGDTPAKSDAKGAPPPKADLPKPDATKPDIAKAETPKADAAKTETPNAEAAKPATGEPAVTKPSAETPVAPVAAPAKSIGDAEQRMLTPTPPKSPPADAKANTPAKPAAPPAAGAPASAAAAPAAVPASDVKAAPSGSFAVQLAAFSDDKGANALANKLQKAGYTSAHVEAVESKGSKLWRVRVGGFATRADAEAARVKLKNEGFNGMVTPAR